MTDLFEVEGLLSCTAIELFWRGRDSVCYSNLEIFVDNGYEPLILVNQPVWLSYGCNGCRDSIKLATPPIESNMKSKSKHLASDSKIGYFE